MMSNDNIKKENATDIVNKFLHRYPKLKYFLNQLLRRDVNVEIKQVSPTFQYPDSVTRYKLAAYNGCFMNCFIQKVISNKFRNEEIRDNVTELILKDEDKYFTKEIKSKILPTTLQKHYNIFKDPNSRAIDIIESIKIVTLAWAIYYNDPLPQDELETNYDNLLAIIKYFENLHYSSVELNANVNSAYFEGKADLIVDGSFVLEIKTSKFKFLKHSLTEFDLENFYKLILYGFGYYKKTGRIIKCFKIYNTLLGKEYKIQINDIDMKQLEDVLKKDILKGK